jgi:hypothetical protein
LVPLGFLGADDGGLVLRHHVRQDVGYFPVRAGGTLRFAAPDVEALADARHVAHV